MSLQIRATDYYYVSVPAGAGEAWSLLERLAKARVNLLAFSAIPMGPSQTQFALFPDPAERLLDLAESEQLAVTGPYPAVLVQGDDRLGVLAELHSRLGEAGVEVFASSGVTDGRGGFGYVLYVKPDQAARALSVLES